MKTNKDALKESMDRRLSFLDDVPSCRAKVMYRIAQKEEPVVMKKKFSVGLVLTVVLCLLSVTALAAGLLLSSRVSATQIADRELEKQYGVTAEMQTFFAREEKEMPDGAVQVTYTGASGMEYVLGSYTALIKDGKAEITWSHDGEETSGGYEAEAWGVEQLRQMMADSLDQQKKDAFMSKAEVIGAKHSATEDEAPSHAIENYYEQREADKTAALKARKLSEDEMIRIGREFIIGNYGLNEEQIARLELYTNSFEDEENCWYEMINEKPCFQVEYLLYNDEYETGDMTKRTEMNGYYNVFVNVETGAVEEYEYNSSLAGQG
ncbi:MAG: hypothetical protein IKH57_04440 [Clostridia bacterium]|nr:hypothetical protein [Clostridia bacterium]